MNILGPNARAPLHIGDSSIGQYPSGSWIAEFLIALPLGTLFIEIMAWCLDLKKICLSNSFYHRFKNIKTPGVHK